MSSLKKTGSTLIPRRTFSLKRLLLQLFGLTIGLQGMIVLILQVISVRRKRHQPQGSFPHQHLEKVLVGENVVQLYDYGRELYDAMLLAIDNARESIYLETYIWKNDVVGQAFKDHLARKAAEGVEVYVIYDNFANLVVPGEFKVFPSNINALCYYAIRSPLHLFDPRRYALDHRKLLVVDGTIGFIGGYNLGALYATKWRDTHLRIQGQAAADLAQSFTDFWNLHNPTHKRLQRHYVRRFDPLITARETNAMRLTFPIRDMYIEAIGRAEQRVMLTDAYFVPDRVLLDELKDAAKRGVDTRVLIPWTSNHIVVDWLTRGYLAECLQAGIRIFGYRHMLHAKTCTIDGQWSTIGTANLDRLSSVGNYEINVEVFSEKLAQQMEELFVRDIGNASELTLEKWLNRPWYMKLSERILTPLRLLL
ncbi:MAG TPA: phosphatidylserine/phosphatidylglycerophosphate/cardiolipin synthase family protein [Ktedonobacteraceae bacterium]|nr:phosphatidylserine/phosphatidylglycerophosphate/cardiolipin synthase family protein [Ktedonobacteraceae bacterium]